MKSAGARLLRPARPLVLPAFAADDHVTERARTALAPPRRTRVPVMVVCSARPRVGRTLLARLLTEFLLADGRPALAFDANPNDRALSAFLPAHTMTAEIAETRSQMALFDRLVTNDGAGKVVDLAPELSFPFFDLVERLDFVAAARANGIDTFVLLLEEDHRRSAELAHMLANGYSGMPVVPVLNEAVVPPDFPASAGPSIKLPALSRYHLGIVNRHGFSFAQYLRDPANVQTSLAAWIRRRFLVFRALELRLMLAEVDRSFDAASLAPAEA